MFIVAENLILPSAIDTCEVVFGEECAAKLKAVLLFIYTIGRWIERMPGDVKFRQKDYKGKNYSSDATNTAQQ